jgi:hypothetical protein
MLSEGTLPSAPQRSSVGLFCLDQGSFTGFFCGQQGSYHLPRQGGLLRKRAELALAPSLPAAISRLLPSVGSYTNCASPAFSPPSSFLCFPCQSRPPSPSSPTSLPLRRQPRTAPRSRVGDAVQALCFLVGDVVAAEDERRVQQRLEDHEDAVVRVGW